MAVREGRHRVVDDLQHRRGGGPYRLVVALPDDRRKFGPDTACCGQVQVDSSPHRDALLCSATALQSYRVNLCTSWELAERRCVGEHRQIVAEELSRHAPGVMTGQFSDAHQPLVVLAGELTGRRCAALAS